MLEILLAVIVSTALNFVGLIVNLFIAVITYKTWVKNHRISSSDKILFSLGISRCLMLGLSLLALFYFIFPSAGRRHIQTMQRNASGFWNPQTEAHMGAVKLMVYSLLLYIPYSVAALSLHLHSSVEMDVGTRSLCVVISAVYHPGHSVLIILTHPKLKTKAEKVLCFNKWWNIRG
ncbi:taste receptor type 2 member 4 [Pteronotus mesoamericanus]|uniref:taste receptor type 2 member 4 n=1 Tax=Pteronotus mesoamericanus TaxID=1884717 RepID=UPI0023EBD71D|nr:taste receptor type 2 member 4 [Pteronotus parnellii mesoamericanus]